MSLPFWWGINLFEKNLNDFFFWREVSQNSQVLTAQISFQEKSEDLKPFRDRRVEDLKLEAKSAISILVKNNGGEKILFEGEENRFSSSPFAVAREFEKDINRQLPIASLTKLMTALVVLENYDLSKEIKISEEAVAQEESLGSLEAGKTFSVKYLLYPLLMESSNDAAFALADDYEEMTEEKFVTLMNLTAQKLNLNDTFFINPTGLDPQEPEAKTNYSTVRDLSKLAEELLKQPLIWEILSAPKYNLYGPALANTNELLFDESLSWQARIIGGKTGHTDKALGCMLLVLKAPANEGYLINVILGTNNRFGEMKKLVEWIDSAYKW